MNSDQLKAHCRALLAVLEALDQLPLARRMAALSAATEAVQQMMESAQKAKEAP